MNILEIMKTSLIYPANDLKTYLIFGVICLLASISSIVTVLTDNYAALLIAGIIAIIFAIIMLGYSLNVIKAGIEKSEELPGLDLINQFVSGIKTIIVSLIYYIIPIIITIILAFVMNIPNRMMALITTVLTQSPEITRSVIESSAATDFFVALGLFSIISIILFIIFTFFALVGCCRLANTDSIKTAVNFKEAFADLKAIGILKIIGFVILLVIILAIIGIVVGFILGLISSIGVAGIIISAIISGLIVNSYLTLFKSYATGLVYSDI